MASLVQPGFTRLTRLLTRILVQGKDYGCNWILNPLLKSVSSEISRGWKSSRRLCSLWITVLRPLEFVNLPSKEEIDAMVFICFASSVFQRTATVLYNTFVVVPSTGVKKNFPGTLSPWGRWPTYSTKARYGSLSPPSVFHVLVLYCCARFLELPSSPWRFFLWRSLYSTYSSLTVKSFIWHRLVPSRYLSVSWGERRLGIRLRCARGLIGREEGKIATGRFRSLQACKFSYRSAGLFFFFKVTALFWYFFCTVSFVTFIYIIWPKKGNRKYFFMPFLAF